MISTILHSILILIAFHCIFLGSNKIAALHAEVQTLKDKCSELENRLSER